jgi:hypothetical protein
MQELPKYAVWMSRCISSAFNTTDLQATTRLLPLSKLYYRYRYTAETVCKVENHFELTQSFVYTNYVLAYSICQLSFGYTLTHLPSFLLPMPMQRLKHY